MINQGECKQTLLDSYLSSGTLTVADKYNLSAISVDLITGEILPSITGTGSESGVEGLEALRHA